jgi:alpha-L-fucosidase
MFDLELMNIDKNGNHDEGMPCLPFEESLDEDLKNAQSKTLEELDDEWNEENESAKEQVDEYFEYIENLRHDLINFDNDDDEYSSGEEIPDCNPWRE